MIHEVNGVRLRFNFSSKSDSVSIQYERPTNEWNDLQTLDGEHIEIRAERDDPIAWAKLEERAKSLLTYGLKKGSRMLVEFKKSDQSENGIPKLASFVVQHC